MANVGSVSFTLEANKKGFKSATKGLRDVEKGVKSLLNVHTKGKGKKAQRAFTPRQSMQAATQRQADIDKGMKKIRTLSAGRGLKNKARGSIARLEALGNAGVKQIKKVKAAMKEVSAAAKDESPVGDLRRAVAAFDLTKRIEKGDRKLAREKAKQDAIKKTEQAEKKAAAEASKAEKDKQRAINKTNKELARQVRAFGQVDERVAQLKRRGKEVGASPQQMAAITRAVTKYKQELKAAGDDTLKIAKAQTTLNQALNRSKRAFDDMKKAQQTGGGKLSAEQRALNQQNKARAQHIRLISRQREQMHKLIQQGREAGASDKQIRKVTQAYRTWRLETKAANGDIVKLAKAEAKLANTTNRLSREFKNLKAASAGRGIGKLALRMRNLESASILAVGPLSGIGARIRSLGAISGRSSLSVALLIGTFTGLSVAAYKVIKAGIMVNREMEKMNARFEVSAGSSFLARREMAHLVKVTTKYGVSFQETARGYSRFVAAAAAGNIELSTTRNMMEAVVKAGAALKLTGYDMEGIFRAFEQIVSKGTVSSEELRNQLGDRLTGALQIAAKGYDTNVAGLLKMIKAGEVFATEFLPKMSAAIEETYGHKAADNVKTFSGSLNVINNQFKIFAGRVAEGSGAMAVMKRILFEVAQHLEWLNKTLEPGALEKLSQHIAVLAKRLGLVNAEYEKMRNTQKDILPDPQNITQSAQAISILRGEIRKTTEEYERAALLRSQNVPGSLEVHGDIENGERALKRIRASLQKLQATGPKQGQNPMQQALFDWLHDRKVRKAQSNIEFLVNSLKELRNNLHDLFIQAGRDPFGKAFSKLDDIQGTDAAKALESWKDLTLPDYDPAKAEKLSDALERLKEMTLSTVGQKQRLTLLPDAIELRDAHDVTLEYLKMFKKGTREYDDAKAAVDAYMSVVDQLIKKKRAMWAQDERQRQSRALDDVAAKGSLHTGELAYYERVTVKLRDYRTEMKKVIGEGELLRILSEKQQTILEESYDIWHRGQREAYAMSIAMDNMNDSMKDLPEIDQKFYKQYVIPFIEGSKVIRAFAKDSNEAREWIAALQKALAQRFENNLGRELKALEEQIDQLAQANRAAQQGEWAQAWYQGYILPVVRFTKEVLKSTKDLAVAQELINRFAKEQKLKFEIEYDEEKLKQLKEYIDDFEHKTLMIRVQTQIEGLSDYDRALWQQVVLPYQEAMKARTEKRTRMLKYYQDKGLSPEEIAKILPSDEEFRKQGQDRLAALMEGFHAKDQTPKFTALRQEIDALNAESEALMSGSKAYERFRHIEGPVMQRRLELMAETGDPTKLSPEQERELSSFQSALEVNNEAIKQFERTQAITDALTRGFTDLVIKGREFGDVLKNIVSLLARMVLNKFFEGIAGGIAGFISGGLFRGLPGAKYGMHAKIAGGGGPDSRIAAMRVSPGETLTVRTPAQQDGIQSALERVAAAAYMGHGGGGGISITNHNDFSGSDPGSVDRILSYIDTRDAQTVNQVQDLMARRRIGYGRRRGRV